MKNSTISFGDSFSNVVFLGPEYRHHRGGIGAVIASYASEIDDINFIPTYNGRYGKAQNLLLALTSFFKLTLLLLTHADIKIVHIHSASNGSFYRKFVFFFLAKKIFNRKVVFHLHGAKFHLFYEKSGNIGKRIIKYLAQDIDVFICLSIFWKEYLETNFRIKKLVILNNPVEQFELFDRIAIDNKLHFLFLGMISDRKGIFDLLNVIVQNKVNWKDKFYLTIGGNGQIEKLEGFIRENELSGLVEYIGWVDGEKKKKLLSNCDVLILPSYNEGLPIAILEAMSNGKAIVSTNVGGIPEVVIHNHNGFVLSPGDSIGLCNFINQMIDEPNFVKVMGDKSLSIIRPYYIKNVLSDLSHIYSLLK